MGDTAAKVSLSKLPRRHNTIGEVFDPRFNSLNFLRLVLAICVVVSHTVAVNFYGKNLFGRVAAIDNLNRTTIGTIAVYGFFGISGFLIVGSATRNNVGRYLWQRFLRIFPAFWICLVLTALLFGVVGWISNHPPLPGGLNEYFNATNGPLSYIYRNSLLQLRQGYIAGTIWNGSIWTLFFEFLCYLLLAAMALIGVLRHRILVAGIAVAFWLADIVATLTPSLNQHFGVKDNWVPMSLVKLGTIFLVGSLIYLYRDRVPDSGVLALACAIAFTASLWLPTDGRDPAAFLEGSQLLAPLIAYPVLWLGMHLPLQRVGARNDYSYGVYIYAFPVEILLLIWGAARWGYPTFLLLVLLGTVPFAIGSWWLIERRALSKKQLDWNSVWVKLVGEPRAKSIPVDDPVALPVEPEAEDFEVS